MYAVLFFMFRAVTQQ
uniref:Uncharacterized protein n=1 Tax=Anguilla anguilla TaxID=7936 RepID=A0A0E9XRJ0_ANGAN